MSSSTARPVYGAASAPLRIAATPAASEYSCRGIDPFGVIRSRQYVPGTSILVDVRVPGWYNDPRGHCGECPACQAGLAPDKVVWAAVLIDRVD